MQSYKFLSLLFFLLLFTFTKAQKIAVNNDTEKGSLHFNEKAASIAFHLKTGTLNFTKKEVNNIKYAVPHIDGYINTNEPGKPVLPVLSKLIEVPVGATISINIKSYSERTIDLNQHHIKAPIIPAQPPVSKTQDQSTQLFHIDAGVYSKDGFVKRPLVTIDTLGTMRSARLARINIAPLSYNPVTHKLNIVEEVQFEIIFKNADHAATMLLKETTYSPFFENSYRKILNHQKSSHTKSNQTQYPVKYVIVSDPMFQSALQPFITWKTQKGFEVIEAYTNDPAVGSSNTSIKLFLDSLYFSATPSSPAFSFLLLVGDINKIPSFKGVTGGHVTDLYYAEFTGDFLPEVYYGRFSASTVAELQVQIDKTLAYEQYNFPSTSFLGNALLVSGTDATFAPIHGNGHINYGTDYYFNTSQNITALTYLYPASSGQATQIKQDFSNGVGFVNYTAHCTRNGWAGPQFNIADIGTLSNADKYPVMIGNCCSSSDFGMSNSFAEEMLRAQNKGAVGYIGASNNTYWDEDYWWGVGFKNITVNPSYNPHALGAFDRFFHTHNEPFSEWFTTQGQIIAAGNLAVSQSLSNLSNYYWEVYHLMGDPSLTPYLFEPPPLNITSPAAVPVGISNMTLITEPYTYIGLTKNDSIYAAGLTNASGYITLNFPTFNNPGQALLVASKQNRQTFTSHIHIFDPNGAYVIYNGYSLDDSNGNDNGLADYGEHVRLKLSLENIGNLDAFGLELKLSTSDKYVAITDSLHFINAISQGAMLNDTSMFAFTIADSIPDGYKVYFSLNIKDQNDSIWDYGFTVPLNAPLFEIINTYYTDHMGQEKSLFEPGETLNYVVEVMNKGGADAFSGYASLASFNHKLSVNTSTSIADTIKADSTVKFIFNLTADATMYQGESVSLYFELNSGYYSLKETLPIIIGEIPVLFMKDTVMHTCMLYFYDSGGPDANYANDENYTVTFFPTSKNAFVRATFIRFSVEDNPWGVDCWDELQVYNGADTNAPLLGKFCGDDIPGPFIADNPDGALTFRFISDFSVTKSGWEALIECLNVGTQNLNASHQNFNVYPNPTTGKLTLENNITRETMIQQIAIYNAQGKKVYKKPIIEPTSTRFNISLEAFSSGFYYLKIYHDKGINVKKIIKH